MTVPEVRCMGWEPKAAQPIKTKWNIQNSRNQVLFTCCVRLWRQAHATLDSKGAFHSTKTFENLETGANGREISRKCFPKLWKLLNFRNANHLSTKNSRNPGWEQLKSWMERKLIPGKSLRRFGYTPRGCPTFKNFGKCCAINSLVLEVAENSNRTFWLKWKHAKFVGARVKDLWSHLQLFSFFVFIFRAPRPCDQDSPISAWNGNQSTEHPARMTMNVEQELSKRGDLTPDSFVYWKGKHIFLERKAIKNTWPFIRLIEVEEKARVLEEQARIQ